MKERILDRILYYFCRLFGIIRSKTYIVFPDGNYSRSYLKSIPNIIHLRINNKDYNVISVVAEPINKAMVYYYIKTEDMINNLNNESMNK